MVNEVVDLTYSKNQRKTLLKEVILPNGTKIKVPLRKWVKHIIANPKGRTAQLAKETKDPDLAKIKIPGIRQRAFHRVDPARILDPGARARRQPTKRGDLTFSPVSSEAARRRGYMSAEEGKGFGNKKKEKKK